MIPESVMSRLDDERPCPEDPVDVRNFVSSFHPHDIEAGQFLARAFHAGLLRGRLVARTVDFDGHISAIVDRTRPVWH